MEKGTLLGKTADNEVTLGDLIQAKDTVDTTSDQDTILEAKLRDVGFDPDVERTTTFLPKISREESYEDINELDITAPSAFYDAIKTILLPDAVREGYEPTTEEILEAAMAITGQSAASSVVAGPTKKASEEVLGMGVVPKKDIAKSQAKDLKEKFGFTQDNPATYSGEQGENWLVEKMRMAAATGDPTRLRGSVTATLGKQKGKDMYLPVDMLKNLKGAKDEIRKPGEYQYERLMKDVTQEGFDPSQKGNKINIGVNAGGQPYILEGNTRVAVASDLGIPYVRVEINYFNGGEMRGSKGYENLKHLEYFYPTKSTSFSPDNVISVAKTSDEIKNILKGSKKQFNKGGTTMKNNPPVGSFPEEVADDIPAMISEGEFVIPADVVRYVGLDKIHCMMRDAKMGLKAMEQDGLIVDVDEEGRPEQPQEEPKGEVAIIDVVQIEKAEPMVKELKEGGVVSPILNPEEEVNVMNQGGMLRQEVRPDGSLRVIGMQEGGMPMQMEQMMAEEMPQEAPDIAEEMPPAQTDRMANAPTLNAPLAQVIDDVPHVLAYLKEDEIKALHSAGRGLDPEGKQMLSPEGVPVFNGNGSAGDGVGGDNSGSDDTGASPDSPDSPTGEMGGGPPGGVGGDQGRGGSGQGGQGGPGDGPGDGPGGSDDDDISKMQKELTKEDKEALDPSSSDRIYKEGVGFIDKIINKRLQSQVNRPNPLQGMPQYNVATVAQGGLMRSPVYLENGGMMDDEDNRRFEGDNVGGSIPTEPGESPVLGESPVRSPVAPEGPVRFEEAPNFDENVTRSRSEQTVPEGIMQPDGAIVSESGITMRAGESDLRRDLSAIGGVNQASIDYLSQNFDVAQSILGGEEKDGATINREALRHFNEFGKNEDREGDGQFQAQLRFPDLVDDQGNPTSVAGPSGYYDAAKILEDQPETSDAALDYLTKNKDVFENATGRVESDEGVSYEDVAREHFNLFGKDEDRRGTEGLMSMQDDAPGEGRFGIPTPVPDAPLTDGIMSPPEESRSPEEPTGSYIYNKDMFANNAEMLDQETNELLRSYGIDSGEWGDSISAYRAGKTDSLNSKLVDDLNKLDDKRRIIKEGITLDDIPEGATNRDVYKKVFFNQTRDFGSKYVDPVQGRDYDQNRYDAVENILNADLSKFDPKTRRGAEALATLQLFKLDEPASETDLKYINAAISNLASRQAIPGYDDRGTYDTNPYDNKFRVPRSWEFSKEARLQRIDDLMKGRETDMTSPERLRHLKEDVYKSPY